MKHRALLLILLVYLGITLAYGVVNPLFEAPDEHWHYFTTQYIAETGQLPRVAQNYDEWMSQEAAQPPLYYLIGSLLIAPIDTSQAHTQVWLNPFSPTAVGNAAALTNKNIAVHTAQEAWPWQGYVLAAHLLRIFSTLLGAGTLLCIYASGRLLWPHHPRRALLAAALVAFLPQFNFTHAAISNDTLITFLAAFTIWQLLSLWLKQPTWPRLLLLGLTIGAAALSKTAGIPLLIYACGVLFLLGLRHGRYQLWLQTLLLVVLPVFAIAGWLWWRNWTLYGDITAVNQFIRVAGGDRAYTLLQVFQETPGLWLSLFAVFGWFNVRAPEWIYWLWSALVAAAVIGALYQGITRLKTKPTFSYPGLRPLLQQTWLPALLLLGWFTAVYAGLVTFMLRTPAAQGRLLFPALIPLVMALVYGLTRFRWPGPAEASLYRLVPALALLTTLYTLIFVIPPTYALPPTVTALPPEALPLNAAVGQGLVLAGALVETEAALPGEAVWLTLYWQAQHTPTTPPELVVELFGHDLNQPIGKLHSYHGRGLYPATQWPTHTLIADRFGLRLDTVVSAPVLAQAFVRLADTEQTGVHVGDVKVAPLTWPDPPTPALAQLGEDIRLSAVSLSPTTAQPGDTVHIDAIWHVLTPPTADFTTLIHLAQAGQPPLATGDSPPRNGRYPTRVWAADEVIDDRYTLTLPPDLPPGHYPIWIGMYDPVTQVRLPLTADGTPQPHNAYLVGTLIVTP